MFLDSRQGSSRCWCCSSWCSDVLLQRRYRSCPYGDQLDQRKEQRQRQEQRQRKRQGKAQLSKGQRQEQVQREGQRQRRHWKGLWRQFQRWTEICLHWKGRYEYMCILRQDRPLAKGLSQEAARHAVEASARCGRGDSGNCNDNSFFCQCWFSPSGFSCRWHTGFMLCRGPHSFLQWFKWPSCSACSDGFRSMCSL